MATITKAQYEKWTADAQKYGTDWKFDFRYYVLWGEKEVIKLIEEANGEYTQMKIGYRAEYRTVVNEYGCKYNRPTGNYIPTCTVARLIPTTSGCYRVIPQREYVVGDAQTKKNYAYICKCIANADKQYEEVG